MTDTMRFDKICESSQEVDVTRPHLVVQNGLHVVGAAVKPSTTLAVNELLAKEIAEATPNLGVTRILAEAFPDSATLAVELSTLIQSLVIKCLAAVANREPPVQDIEDPAEFVSTLLLLMGSNIRANGLSPETMRWFDAALAQVGVAEDSDAAVPSESRPTDGKS